MDRTQRPRPGMRRFHSPPLRAAAAFVLVVVASAVVATISWVGAKEPAGGDSAVATARRDNDRLWDLLDLESTQPTSARRRGAPRAAPHSADGKCLECHQVDAALSHPVGMKPNMVVPAHLPLVEGRVSCLTCHTEADEAAHAAAMSEGDAMLRTAARGPAFCGQCHQSDPTGGGHATRLGRAHLAWPGQQATAGGADADRLTAPGYAPSQEVTRFTAAEGLDPLSRDCLSCHDGTGGPAPGIGHGHPVGVLYQKTRRVAGRSGLTPEAQLDPRIQLFDQRVGCGSCHNPFHDEPDMLVMSNENGNLCKACHQGY